MPQSSTSASPSTATGSVAATCTITPPEKFDFTQPENWPKWIRRYGRYRVASGLYMKDEEIQVNSLLYTMGDEADDVLASFIFDTPDDKGKYDKVKEKFDHHFVVRRNTIYERAKFNQRVQGVDEPVDSFITALYCLVEHCEYGTLRDEMIRDRLVVGLRNGKLSEKLQMDATLSLEKAVNTARQSESVHKQQEIVRGASAPGSQKPSSVDAVRSSRFRSRKKDNFKRKDDTKMSVKNAHKTHKTQPHNCQRCGNAFHKRQICPARDATCHSCGAKGHFARLCKSKKLNEIEVVSSDGEYDGTEIFLGEISDVTDQQKAWATQVTVNGKSIKFKLDSGADVSVISSELYKAISKDQQSPLKKTNKKLYGPCRYELLCKGKFSALLMHRGKSCVEEIYVIDNLEQPLLSRPACCALGIIAKVEEVASSNGDRYRKKHPNLFQGLGCMSGEYDIKLDPNVKPFNVTTPRRVPIPMLPKVEAELRRMEKMGVIEKVDQPTEWCSPMVVVPKSNGKVRICGDFIQLNKAVQRENHPMPTTEQTLAKLAGAKIVTKLDANSGFWQRKLSKNSKLHTTFITPWGRHCYTRLPFGISSAPEHFQRTMHRILEGLKGVECQMDDILVYGATIGEHDERVEAVLKRLEEANVTLNPEKCLFAQETVSFLGQLVGKHGIQADPAKVEAVRQMKKPTNVAEIRRFLGMVNQLGKYIPNLAEKSKPLRDLLSDRNAWIWGPAQQAAFEKIKTDLSSTPVLAIYDPSLETCVTADASSYGLGAVLLQKQADEEWKPVAYISRALTPTEQRYAQIEKEALATTWACERLSDYLLGKTFHVETDHKPLVPLLGSKNLDEMPPRIQRLRLRLLKYQFTISHVPGKNLVLADTLSRAPLEAEQSSNMQEEIDLYVDTILAKLPASDKRLQEIRLKQEDDEVCRKLAEYCAEGWPDRHRLPSAVKPYWPERGEISQVHGLLLKGCRIIIPSSMRLEMLDCIHSAHQGVTKCRQRAKTSVWWPGLSRQVEDMVRSCRKCIEHRKPRPEPMIPSAIPERPWQVIGTDLYYLKSTPFLVVIDYFSRYVEVSPLLSSQKSLEVVRALKSMFARHGIPETVRSDNGPQYDSAVFAKFSKDWNFDHVTSSPNYAQSNGEVERAVQTVKNLLTKAEDPAKALLEYRATPLECNYSPAELLFGRKIRSNIPTIPSQLQPKWPDLDKFRASQENSKEEQSAYYNVRHRTRPLRQLQPRGKVWVRDMKLPATITRQDSAPRSYIASTPHGTTLRRNRRDLIPLTPSASDTTPCDDPPPQSSQPPSGSASPTRDTPSVVTRSGRVVKPPKRLDV